MKFGECSGVVPGIDADVGCGGGGCWLMTSGHCFAAAAACGWFAAAVCLSRCPSRCSSAPSSGRRQNGSRLPAVSQPGVFETGRLARVRFEQGSPFLAWSGLSAAASVH